MVVWAVVPEVHRWKYQAALSAVIIVVSLVRTTVGRHKVRVQKALGPPEDTCSDDRGFPVGQLEQVFVRLVSPVWPSFTSLLTKQDDAHSLEGPWPTADTRCSSHASLAEEAPQHPDRLLSDSNSESDSTSALDSDLSGGHEDTPQVSPQAARRPPMVKRLSSLVRSTSAPELEDDSFISVRTTPSPASGRPCARTPPSPASAASRHAQSQSRQEVIRLELRCISLHQELMELERYVSCKAQPGPLQLGVLKDEAAFSSKGSPSPQDWRARCEHLSRELELLTADALEESCVYRATAAMEVFQQASTALERMADLLSVPKGCDAVEWRIVSSVVGAEEKEALKVLVMVLREQGDESGATDREDLHPLDLLRFLRARNGCVPEAATMFAEAMAWRSSYGIDLRLEEWTAELAAQRTVRARLVEQFRVHETIGTDRAGVPITLFRWSVFDVAGLERELGHGTMLQVLLCIHEQLLVQLNKAMLTTRKHCSGALFVWDVGNYGSKHGCPQWINRMMGLLRFLPKVTSLLAANYPEVVRRIMIVRCGPGTKALYRTAAALMPSGTLAKSQLYGWHAQEWLQDLRDEIVGGSVPSFLTSDDDEALASATPRGGLCPRGAGASG